jgi:hypothetical protein
MVIPEIQHDLLIMRTGEVILRLPKRKVNTKIRMEDANLYLLTTI